MVVFTFASGKEQEFDYDWTKLAPKLQLGGLRLFQPRPGVMIPLNSNTIALIENISEEEDEEPEALIRESQVQLVEPTPEPEVEEKPLSIEEKKEQILAEMKEKSECEHENHDYYYQEILSGKGLTRKPQKRYFPVCSFCGVRERYVKADSLTDDEKLNARVWDK